jgi:4-hydroxyproline epimerase
MTKEVHVIDSHTGGEPTRVVVAGGPHLGRGSMAARLDIFRVDHDRFRSAIVNEPRGSDAMVGALLCEPLDSNCAAGVIFFNNVGYLGMCGHGAIGLVATLSWQSRIQPGHLRIETPVGTVGAELHTSGDVTVANVASYRLAAGVEIDVDGFGRVKGDVAWGGNWFFLVDGAPCALELQNLEALTAFAWNIRQALARSGVTGAHSAEIDHIEIFGPAQDARAQSRNFVLCPGKAYDRSPCGTGTSAKLACLYADGKLRQGEIWRQESIAGSVFEGHVEVRDGLVFPFIRGGARGRSARRRSHCRGHGTSRRDGRLGRRIRPVALVPTAVGGMAAAAA